MDREQILADLYEWIQNLRDRDVKNVDLTILEIWLNDRERMYE